MIKSFRSKDSKALFDGKRVLRFQSIERAAVRKLEMIDGVTTLADLQAVPGNRLEGFEVTERVSTASESTNNGAFVSYGASVAHTRLRSSTTVRERRPTCHGEREKFRRFIPARS